jgi:rod shape-determining protein MreC
VTGDGPPRVSRRRIALRRGVVLGLLLICVLLFTSFFREDEGGFLHNVKGTIGAIVTPVQDVAVAAVQPVKDGWNWFAELRTARAERDRLLAENAELTRRLTQANVDASRIDDFRTQLRITQLGVDDYTPIPGTIIGRSPFDYYKRVGIDRGTNHGVTVNSLVFVPGERNGETFPALIGLVTRVETRSATVTFITDPNTTVAARSENATSNLGLLRAGPAGQLKLEGVPAGEVLVEGDVVVTTGEGTVELPSVYPPGIPLGRIKSVSPSEPDRSQSVQVEPFRDPVELSTLVVFAPKSALAQRRAKLP